jgi:hypothetical protein
MELQRNENVMRNQRLKAARRQALLRRVPGQVLERMLAGDNVSDDGQTASEVLSGCREGEQAQPADHRGCNRATFSRGPSSPRAGRRNGSPRHSSTSAVS